MNKYLYTLLLAFSSLFMAEAQQLFDLKRCIETGLEQNYSIRIIRNEQQISDNNATPGNAGYLPTVDMSGGFSGNINNNRNSLQDGSIEKANGINSETGNVGLNVNWTVFDGFGIQAEYSRLKELQRMGELNTRMTIEDMLPALETLDSIGYYSLECWGGATFDACMRFLGEDPWERLRTIRKHVKNTKLQMLFRGQNILGYKHYADDVVDAFCRKSIENGIDIIRIFDALNDVRNLEQAIKSTKKYGGQVEATLSYTMSPIHNEAYFVKLAKELEEMGADMICIKDMANLLLPMDAYSLVKALKETVSVPIHLHTHNTSGTGDMTLLMAAYAGVDIVDTALSPMANGTSQPATESLVATLKGTVRDTGLDLGKMSDAAVHFRQVAQRLQDAGILDPKVLRVDTNTLLYQVPGGMLSNLISQLKQAGKEDKYYDVLAEIPRVRKDFGYPPLVTPSSQIVGTQAVLNVIMGERYKMVPKESKKIMMGEFGQTVTPVNKEVQKKIIGDETPITCRPADLIPPQLPQFEKECAQWKQQEEDVLSYALFPKVAEEFFKYREAQQTKVDAAVADTANKAYPV